MINFTGATCTFSTVLNFLFVFFLPKMRLKSFSTGKHRKCTYELKLSSLYKSASFPAYSRYEQKSIMPFRIMLCTHKIFLFEDLLISVFNNLKSNAKIKCCGAEIIYFRLRLRLWPQFWLRLQLQLQPYIGT